MRTGLQARRRDYSVILHDVARTLIRDGVTVSTIYFNGQYETQVLGGPMDGERQTHPTEHAALSGHEAMVQKVIR
jgi:hypothetical protein